MRRNWWNDEKRHKHEWIEKPGYTKPGEKVCRVCGKTKKTLR